MLRYLRPDAHVLEVGCGTGQVTLPLAQAGLRVHALELGPALAELTRTNLSQYPNVTVQTVAFEDFRSDTRFDALVSVQAFHWVAPEAGLAHAASLLRPGGALLLAWHQDRSRDTPFYRATNPVYERYESPLETRPTPTHAPERFNRGAGGVSPVQRTSRLPLPVARSVRQRTLPRAAPDPQQRAGDGAARTEALFG